MSTIDVSSFRLLYVRVSVVPLAFWVETRLPSRSYEYAVTRGEVSV